MDDIDPVRTFTAEEQEILTGNLTVITKRIHQIDKGKRDYSVALLHDWHYALFHGVRNHAGRFRTREYGEQVVTFGDQRSTPSEFVEKELNGHIRQGKMFFDDLDSRIRNSSKEDFNIAVITVAVWMHADFIRIHPFRDGNGRTGRLIATYFLRAYGLPAYIVETPKQEYIACLNHFYKTRDIDPLVHFSIRLIGNLLNY